jgi:hypothetical protein
MNLPVPDWEKLREIESSMSREHAAGSLSDEGWKAYMDQAIEAAAGCSDLIGFVGRYTQRGWLDRARKSGQQQVPAA